MSTVRRSLSTIACLVLIVSLLYLNTSAVDSSRATGAISLSGDNFEDIIGKYDNAFVMFYADWCGHCKGAMPEIDALAVKLRKGHTNNKIIVAKLDAHLYREVGQKYNVIGYPKIGIIRSGKFAEYKGPRTADAFLSFISERVTGVRDL